MKLRLRFVYPAVLGALLAGCANTDVITTEVASINPIQKERCYVVDHTEREAAGRAYNEADDEFYFHTRCDLNTFVDYGQINKDLDSSYLDDRNMPDYLRVSDKEIKDDKCKSGIYNNVPGVDPCGNTSADKGKAWVK